MDDAISLTAQAGKTINEVVYHKEATAEMTDRSLLEEVSSVKDTCPSRNLLAKIEGSNKQAAATEDAYTDVGLLDHISEETETNLLDIVFSVDTVGLQGSESHFDIVTSDPNEESHIHRCCVMTQDDISNPSSWGFTHQNLQEEQAKDKGLIFILDWLKNQSEQDEGTLFLSSSEAKYYRLNRELFKLIDGVLFRNKLSEDDYLLLVIPDSLKQTALLLHHDIPSAGHQGIARTKFKLKEKFFWVNLSKDVESYVLTCSICNKNKKNKVYGKVPLTEFQAGVPMERVHIDFLGPLPKTAKGNEHCLMMVDQFTKWIECVPLPTQKAEETAKAAIDNFSRFGFPLQIFSDQGRTFDSKLFETLCKALQIHKARTTTYRLSANGQVERFNRTLMDAVRCFFGKISR